MSAPAHSGESVDSVATPADHLRKAVFSLALSGAPALALAQARKHPAVFSPVDTASLEQQVIAQKIRWGRQSARELNGPDRFSQIDTALDESDGLLRGLPGTSEYAPVRRAVQVDRVDALAARGRMKEATTLFEQLAQAGPPLPAYALAAAGDAYSYLDQPDRAATLYEQALRTAAAGEIRQGEVQESLFFAYLDDGRYEDAEHLLDEMAAHTPAYVRLAPEPDLPNEDYSRVKKLQAQYLLYTGRTREGTELLDKWRHAAPFNATLRSARADGATIQERPYASWDMYRTTLNEHPDDVETLSGLGRTALELNRYDQATQIVASLGARFPDNASVRALQEEYRAYQSAQLVVEANGERGNSVFADHDAGIDSRLYSPPIAERWRVFGHQFSGRAGTEDGNIGRVRNGIGANYRNDGLELSAEAHRSTGGSARTGGSATASYRPSDHWEVSAGIDTDDNGLPWRAYAVGITGRTATAEVRYIQDNTRYLDLAYAISRFSDSNLRQTWDATWYQRLFSTPRHLMALWVNAETSQNTLANTNYFNPSRDYTAQVTWMYQWTPWKYGEKSFSQRIYLTGGTYKQATFPNGALWEARLEQAWQLSRKATLSYGIGIGSHLYDGTRETTKLIYLRLNLPL